MKLDLSDSAHFCEAPPFLRTIEAPSLRLLPPLLAIVYSRFR